MIPKGYRKLKVGETVKRGDKFSFRGGFWFRTLSPEFKVMDDEFTYIRKRKGRR